MKKIEAIFRPGKLDDVRRALEKIGLPGVTISEVEGHGTQKGITQQWRGAEVKVSLLPKVRIEVVVQDVAVEAVSAAIIKAAKTGEIGDGKIFISPVDNAIRIRTEEQGIAAL
ncbi:MAG: P-II family nitrogen regulator [Deltaproteobacteria bacterium]